MNSVVSQNCFMSSSLLSPMIQVKKQVASGFILPPRAHTSVIFFHLMVWIEAKSPWVFLHIWLRLI